MSGAKDRAAAWVYEGLWGVLAAWFKVPREAPRLPVQGGENVESFRPAEGYLRMMKFLFWVFLWVPDIVILAAWIAITVNSAIAGAILAGPALFLAVVPDVLAYIAIHLRYDTTWYVLSDRSMRLRRGVMQVMETTITYENIQNVTVRQGPLQRYFGIADVVVQTAGGGGGDGKHGGGGLSHLGLIQGVADAHTIRDHVLARIKRSRGAGLGDEAHHPHADHSGAVGAWTADHIRTLREIRDALSSVRA